VVGPLPPGPAPGALHLARAHPEHEYHLYTPKISQAKELQDLKDTPGLTTFAPSTPFGSFWRSYSLTGQLKKDDINLFHGLSGEIPFGIRRGKIKSVVTIHDLIFRIYPETYKNRI